MAAGNAVIGALRVVIGADTAALETGLKGAAVKLGAFAGVGIAAGEAFARGLGNALKGLANAIPQTINDFDNLSKTSQKIGVPVDQLAALQHAAQLSDVSSESLTKGLGKLARSAVDAAQGSTTAVAAYQALGVSFRDANGQIKPVGELLPDIADKFASMKDGSAKTALSMQIFGKAGADLIPLLNGGSAGLNEMTAEAKALGLVISGDTAVTAENFNDNLTRLGGVIRGVVVQVTANILPALAQFSQYLIDTAKNSGFLQTASSILTTAFNGVARALIILFDNAKPIAQLFALWVGSGILVSVGSAAISVGLAFIKLTAVTRTLGLTMAAFEAIRAISTKGLLLIAGIVALASGAFDDFGGKVKSLGNLVANLLPEGAGEAATKILTALGLNLEGLTKDLKSWNAESGKSGGGLFNPNIIKTTKDQLESFIASQYKSIAATEAQAATVGKSAAEQQRMKLTAEAMTIAQQNNIPITEAMRQKIAALGDAAYAAQLKLQGAQLTQQVMTPAEQYQQKLALQQQLFDAGVISAETYGRAQRQASVEAGTAWDIAGASIAGSFQQIAGAFGKQSKTMATIAKAAGIVQATISMFTGAAKALELPFPANLAAMATVLGQGASLVASIKGTQVPKFATGGSMKIGGVGGIDSQRVAFDASPGEIVEVKKNPYGGASSEGGGFREIRVRDLNLRPVWSLDNVRDLIDRINDAVGDGARLKIVTA